MIDVCDTSLTGRDSNVSDGKRPKNFGRNDSQVDENQVHDSEFKSSYSQEQLSRQSTLMLKASFHLINYLMMSVCSAFVDRKNYTAASTSPSEVEELCLE